MEDRDVDASYDIPGIQERAGEFVASSRDAIITVDEQSRIVLFNPAAERMFGCSAKEAIGGTIDGFMPQRFREMHRRHVQQFLSGRDTSKQMGSEGQLWGLRSNGEEFPFEATITKTEVGGARLLGIMLRDITERINARRALEQSEEFSRNLVLHCPVAMVVTRLPEEKCEFVNRKYTELFGYTAEDIPDAEHWWPLAYPDEEYRTEGEGALGGSSREVSRRALLRLEPFEALVRCKDGSQKYIEFGLSFVGTRSVVTFIDLTDRYLAELERRRGEEKFREVAEISPVMFWMTGPDGLCTYLSKSWIELHGHSS